jgi:hypothetical protein
VRPRPPAPVAPSAGGRRAGGHRGPDRGGLDRDPAHRGGSGRPAAAGGHRRGHREQQDEHERVRVAVLQVHRDEAAGHPQGEPFGVRPPGTRAPGGRAGRDARRQPPPGQRHAPRRRHRLESEPREGGHAERHPRQEPARQNEGRWVEDALGSQGVGTHPGPQRQAGGVVDLEIAARAEGHHGEAHAEQRQRQRPRSPRAAAHQGAPGAGADRRPCQRQQGESERRETQRGLPAPAATPGHERPQRADPLRIGDPRHGRVEAPQGAAGQGVGGQPRRRRGGGTAGCGRPAAPLPGSGPGGGRRAGRRARGEGEAEAREESPEPTCVRPGARRGVPHGPFARHLDAREPQRRAARPVFPDHAPCLSLAGTEGELVGALAAPRQIERPQREGLGVPRPPLRHDAEPRRGGGGGPARNHAARHGQTAAEPLPRPHLDRRPPAQAGGIGG